MTEGTFKIWAGQGQGNSIVGTAPTLAAALDYVGKHEGHASFAIQYPDGTYHQWGDGLPTSMTKELIPAPQPMRIMYEVTAMLRYGVTVEGVSQDEASARELAIKMIMKEAGCTRDQILSVDVLQRPRKVQVKPFNFEELTKLPIYEGTPQQKREFELRVMWDCHREGVNARAAGLPKSHATGKLIDPDMAGAWRMGWRQEDEFIKGWRDRETGLPTVLGVANGL